MTFGPIQGKKQQVQIEFILNEFKICENKRE